MRLWTLHPKYLDCRGLVALWRESLLARKVLSGETKGYKNHPQLERFRLQSKPLESMDSYLLGVWEESRSRCYSFDRSKFGKKLINEKIEITDGQILYEFEHLKNKLSRRDPSKKEELEKIKMPDAHPLFGVKKGPVEKWEKR